MTTETLSSSSSESSSTEPDECAALAARLALVGAAPFVAAFIASRSGWVSRGIERARCPVLWATGVPCPSCGSARAFVLLARGDARWHEYNTVTVAYAAAAIVASAALVSLPMRARRAVAEVTELLRAHPRNGALAVAVAAVPAWLIALRRPRIRG